MKHNRKNIVYEKMVRDSKILRSGINRIQVKREFSIGMYIFGFILLLSDYWSV